MATRKKGGGYAAEGEDSGDPGFEGGGEGNAEEARQQAPDDPQATGADAGGSGAGPQAAEEAQQPAPETPVDPKAADVLGKYQPVEVIAGASVCEVTDANNVKERKVLARIHDGMVQLTAEGQWVWDTEFGPNATKT